jgi:penicillin-insensitive murein endopeptidase
MKKIILLVFISVSSFASQSIGFYSKGSQREGVNVMTMANYDKLFVKRGQLYTNKEMASLLNKLAEYIKNKYPNAETMQVGDLSKRGGGKIPRHASHQNGLDVDVVYLRHNLTGQDINNPEWGEYFVINSKVTKNFQNERNFEVFRYLTKSYPVNRIFVDQKIKQQLCSYAKDKKRFTTAQIKENQKVLRFLRPAKYHKTHYHLRLVCPADNKKCVNQGAIPPGDGCNNLTIEEAVSC